MTIWRDMLGTPRDWARDLSVATIVGLFIALMGPFGSFHQPFLQRAIYCVGVGWAGAMIFYPGHRAGLWLAARYEAPAWAASLATSAILCVPIMLLVRAIAPLLSGSGDGLRHSPLGLAYLQVAAIVMPLTLAGLALGRRARRIDPQIIPPARPKILGRLPARLGEDLVALEAEDHYVRVHTSNGSTLILMRFTDAVDEAKGIEGLRVHRSWWVARSAVRDTVLRGRRMDLVLTGGIVAPVTREATSRVRRANWI